MKNTLLLLGSICIFALLSGCGLAGQTPPPPVASHFSVTTVATPQIAGTAFSINITALDASNALVRTYTGTVHFASSDAQAVLPPNSPLSNGAGTFSAMLKTAASQTITVSDAAGMLTPGTSNSIAVSPAAASQLSVTAPANATAGSAFNFTVTGQDQFNNTATAYSGTVHFTSKDGQATLPLNAALTKGTGTFSATLKTAGSQVVTATDTVTASITGTSSSISVSGTATALSITSGALPSGSVGVPYGGSHVVQGFTFTGFPLTAAGGTPPYTWNWNAAQGSSLPLGLPIVLRQSGGSTRCCVDVLVIGGTPTQLGSYETILTVTDSAAATATAQYVIVVGSQPKPLTIVSGQPPDGFLHEPYGGFRQTCITGSVNGFELEASGGLAGRLGASYAWSGSSLPPGLTVSSITLSGPPICPYGIEWVIDGTPTTVGTYTFSVEVTDLETPPATASTQYTIRIKDPAVPVVETIPPPVIGTVNSPYGFNFTATSGIPPYTWSETGALPPGILPLNPAGVLSGTPTATGSFPITVQVQDSHGTNSAPQDFDIQVLANGFKPTGSMATARVLHIATVFRSGSVLVTGGVNTTSFPVTAELFNSGSFTTTPGSMSSIRVSPASNLLQDGKVALVSGGKDASGNSTATAELFDSTVGTFTPIASNMQTARVYHTATLLFDGTVLLTGGLDVSGNPTATAELFDPTTRMFSSVGNMESVRFLHAATLLPDGNVLVTGGLTFGSTFDTAELYDPASKTFTPTGNMTVARAGHTVTALSNGKVLVTGGASKFGGKSLSSTELFDPATGIFTATANMVTACTLHTATLRNDGTVLVAGGNTYFYDGLSGQTLSAVELFDPAAGTFTSVADMTTPRESHTATLLLDGQVLIVGGSIGTLGYSANTTVLATAESYQ
jgi:Galactose oxidase, central domain/Putative Ig domain